MIFIGPAGVPLSCKGRTPLEGVQHCQELGLNAMELQFVRGIRIDDEYAREVGKLGKELGVKLSAHAPYYTNLASDDDKVVQKSIDKITLTARVADLMGCDVVVCHPGFYTTLTKKETVKKATATLETIMDYFEDGHFKVKLGIEVMGKQQTFGDLDEVLALCQAVKGTVPVVDFGHVHARSNGGLKTRQDFQEVFDHFQPLKPDHWYTYFTGITYSNGSELHHVPIKKGDLDFDKLVEVVLDNDLDVTIISNSPIIEHDAMFMKIHIERMLEKRGVGGVAPTNED
jgi:deoxyribonuclease IV